ncbi:MAG: tetratricopeptide repeat-containing sulfotransferase family protein [Steroidobacteraceae bacterium]
MATHPLPRPSRIEAQIGRARHLLQQRQFSQSLSIAEALLGEVPENRDILYLIAVNQRYLGRVADALATLTRFENLHPDYGRLFQERGHCYRALGDASAAICAYQQAVDRNPALPASWKALAALLSSAGRSMEAGNAASVAASLDQLPAAIVTANSLFAEGDTHAAEKIVRQYLQQDPAHVEGMRLLARIGMKLEVLDDAEFLLESVLELAADYHAARYDYAQVLTDRQKHAHALEQVRRLLAIEPRNALFRSLEGNILVGLGDHESALKLFYELRAESPANPSLHLAIAHALKTVGRQQEAIESYRRAAAVRPNFGDAYWSLANLKTYRFADHEIAAMRSQECAHGTPLLDRYHLCFALGKALEDRAQFAESFRFYERGNALKKEELRYDADALERNLRRQAGVCTREFFAAREEFGSKDRSPIFIVGLPRAGSTLVEQILASHSMVEGTKELADIPRLVHHLNGRESDDLKPRYPAILGELSAEQSRHFGDQYIADTQIYRRGKPFFIDKMPNNFRHLGLIHLMLPNAKIIDARREPMACCFSNFKQLFASGQEFSYGLQDIGRYYRSYVELMQHWEMALPGKILRVQHEELVGDLAGNVRRILDFCGLKFESQCIDFHKTERSIRTASSEQVRRPIFKDGLDQWRHFEPWLDPLKAALGPAVAVAETQQNGPCGARHT